MGNPPNIQKILFSELIKFIDDEKLVAFESLIMVNFLELYIICCLNFNPLKLLVIFIIFFLSIFNFLQIAKI